MQANEGCGFGVSGSGGGGCGRKDGGTDGKRGKGRAGFWRIGGYGDERVVVGWALGSEVREEGSVEGCRAGGMG